MGTAYAKRKYTSITNAMVETVEESYQTYLTVNETPLTLC